MTFEEAMVNVGEAIQALEAANAALREELVDVYSDLVAMNCTHKDKASGETRLDSMAISTNARAMRFLAKKGKIVIEKEFGRRVIGKWAKQE